MRIYRIGRGSGRSLSSLTFRAYVGAFSFVSVETSDRRKARKIVRLARALGYADCAFWEV